MSHLRMRILHTYTSCNTIVHPVLYGHSILLYGIIHSVEEIPVRQFEVLYGLVGEMKASEATQENIMAAILKSGRGV